MQKKCYRIAQFGTYDIESLGDTSFPKMFAHGIKKYIACEIELFSLKETEQPYNNNSHVYSFEQFLERHTESPFDAMVIGGGEFIHFKKMNVIIQNSSSAYPEGYIWKKPLEYASKYKIPAYLNCVGVSYDLTKGQQDVLNSYMEQVRYISVRDEYSALRLQTAGLKNVSCVADNLWYMNQMYPEKSMADLRKKIESKTGRNFSEPYIIVQYGTTKNIKALAEQLRILKNETGYRIYLMPVNYCHEDRIGMKLLKQAAGDVVEEISDYFQPDDMIAVISGAKCFIGTSLHGNLTAASYEVPFIGVDMYPNFVSKMDGIFSMLNREAYLIPSAEGLLGAYHAWERDMTAIKYVKKKITQMQLKLDEHFQRIGDSLNEI